MESKIYGYEETGNISVYSGADGGLVYQIDTPVSGYPATLPGLGDVDGDGLSDFAAAGLNTLEGKPLTRVSESVVHVYSGARGELLYLVSSEEQLDGFGGAISGIGNINSDGTPDFIVGAPGSNIGERRNVGSVYVFSWIDGSLLCRLDGEGEGDTFGYPVSGVVSSPPP